MTADSLHAVRARAAALRQQALEQLLERALPPQASTAAAYAPGRCTLVGEHVDYAGGLVLAVAIDLGVAAAVTPSTDGLWRALSAGREVARRDPRPVGDIGDRIFAAMMVAGGGGDPVPMHAAVAATLPESAGLSSSAAVVCAVIAAVLRLQGRTIGVAELIARALRAERDIVGVPVGPLDPHAIVEAQLGSVLQLDCRDESTRVVPWPWTDLVLCVCATGERHDIGGSEYRSRRDDVAGALQQLGAAGCQELDAAAVERAPLPEVRRRRLLHAVTESVRSRDAADAIARGDAESLGAIVSASHRSLRDDLDVSTLLIDSVVQAAVHSPGCLGARIVGGGFGGSVLALAWQGGAERCRDAMARAAGVGAERTWALHPSAGLAQLAESAVRSG